MPDMNIPLLSQPPRRVVSLIPSVTESLFDLGLGKAVVGITDYCTQPEGALDSLARVGGVKDTRWMDIVSLEPDLVIANIEENSREVVKAVQEAGISVWITFPKSVVEAIDDLWTMVGIFRDEAAGQRVRMLETALDWVRLSVQQEPGQRVFCPIWQAAAEDGTPWWMTFNNSTYAGDLLSLVGGDNVFGLRKRKQPLAADLGSGVEDEEAEGDTRYPRVSCAEVIAAQPEVILLPDEPFDFGVEHVALIEQYFHQTPAVQTGRVYRVDGSLLTWHGTRLGKALDILPSLFASE
jgi:ABC-type Fe3+-hydroxamate transport system substrate-binding protein